MNGTLHNHHPIRYVPHPIRYSHLAQQVTGIKSSCIHIVNIKYFVGNIFHSGTIHMYSEDIHVEIGKYICWRVGIAALRGWYSSGALGGSVKSRHSCEAEARDRHNSTWQQPLLHLCRSTCPLLPLSSH